MGGSMTGSDEMLDSRLKTLLPAEYQETYEHMEPKPMRSAGLKYDADGQVAWDQIWGSFCDLAMAGGPPHKGQLLEPGTQADIDAAFDRYDEVAEEICRGIKMVTGLRAYVAPDPGWVCVTCHGDAMSGWLVRAIAMENVAVRRRGAILELPVSPHFRLEKEIKNVITVIAKTCHYWLGHIPEDQQRAIGEESRPGLASRRTDSRRDRTPALAAALPGLARRRVPERPVCRMDDARAGRVQRALAARRHGPLRAGQPVHRPAWHIGRGRSGAYASMRRGEGNWLSF
jgi:hypothetical protein